MRRVNTKATRHCAKERDDAGCVPRSFSIPCVDINKEKYFVQRFYINKTSLAVLYIVVAVVVAVVLVCVLFNDEQRKGKGVRKC